MPWCPNCKTEYQEGIEKCADCGADLVDELTEEVEETAATAELELSEGDTVYETVEGENPEAGEESGQADLSEEELAELAAEMKRAKEPAKVYVSKSDESRDMAQTSVTFLVFAGILITLFVLGALNVIPWFSSIPSIIVLGAMSVGCCLVGINAAFRARRAQGKISDEENIKQKVKEWLDANIVKEDIEEKFASVEQDEERYLKEAEYVKDELMKEIEGLDEALADVMVEEFFDEHMN